MRVYKVEKNWRTRIPVALACGNFAIIKIDTTGLDAEKDDIIGFHLAMYRMTNQHLEQMPHTLECYVMTDKKRLRILMVFQMPFWIVKHQIQLIRQCLR